MEENLCVFRASSFVVAVSLIIEWQVTVSLCLLGARRPLVGTPCIYSYVGLISSSSYMAKGGKVNPSAKPVMKKKECVCFCSLSSSYCPSQVPNIVYMRGTRGGDEMRD